MAKQGRKTQNQSTRTKWPDIDSFDRLVAVLDRDFGPLMWSLREHGKPSTNGSTAKLVMIALVRHAGNEDECYPSVPKIEAFSSMGKGAVTDAIQALEAGQLISITHRRGQTGIAPWEQSSLYRLDWNNIQALPLYKDTAATLKKQRRLQRKMVKRCRSKIDPPMSSENRATCSAKIDLHVGRKSDNHVGRKSTPNQSSSIRQGLSQSISGGIAPTPNRPTVTAIDKPGQATSRTFDDDKPSPPSVGILPDNAGADAIKAALVSLGVGRGRAHNLAHHPQISGAPQIVNEAIAKAAQYRPANRGAYICELIDASIQQARAEAELQRREASDQIQSAMADVETSIDDMTDEQVKAALKGTAFESVAPDVARSDSVMRKDMARRIVLRQIQNQQHATAAPRRRTA